MLVMSKGALTAAQAETYYEEKYSHDDYYSEKQRVIGEWFGRGAEQLGLSGEVANEDFRAILRGLHPAFGEALVHKANGYDDRRAGWDATFNAPKSVSIQTLVGGDGNLIEAHQKSVSRALEELEHFALSRRRGGREWVVTGNVVATRFDHVAARPASSVEDGYTREQVMAFSRRRQDIEQALACEGLAGAEAAQNIAHRTRLSKDQRDEQALKAEWRSRAQEYGIQVEQYLPQSREYRPIQFRYPQKAEEAVRQSIGENSEREAVIDRRALEARALQHAMGQTDLHLIRIESERFRQDGRLIVAGESVNSPRGAYTTPEMIALEHGNIELMRAGQGRAAAIGSPNEVRRWASQRSLLPDQTAVAELTLTSTDWITSIEGRAGAAKTTTVGAIREFAEDQGYTVCGFAPTTRAVKSLSEAGISASTVASLLESQPPHDASREIWIIDESSLLPTRQVNRLLHRGREQNVERIVFVGDQRQHHAIEAGRPVYQMQQAGMPVARLDTIRRQRDPELREAVMHAAKGQVAE